MASEKKNRVHPTQKPCKLFCEIVEKFDKQKEFNRVLDLFGGSGSTLIACEQLGKVCYTMELDPRFVDVIIDRWEQFTGNKAVLINGGKMNV
jgi:DNA modification methylase